MLQDSPPASFFQGFGFKGLGFFKVLRVRYSIVSQHSQPASFVLFADFPDFSYSSALLFLSPILFSLFSWPHCPSKLQAERVAGGAPLLVCPRAARGMVSRGGLL